MKSQSKSHLSDPALHALNHAPENRQSLLLHSGRHHSHWATHSTLAHPQAWFTVDQTGQSSLTCSKTNLPLPQHASLTDNPFQNLRQLLNDPTLPGQWIGYLSYDLARLIEPQKLNSLTTNFPDLTDAHEAWPLIELGYCPEVQTFPTLENAPPSPQQTPAAPLMPPPSNFTPDQFRAAISQTLDYIAAGDIFQANIAQQFTTTYTGEGGGRALFNRLAAVSPAWYGAYLELPSGRRLLSTSPELFLRVDHNHVTTRPIKGTRPSSTDPAELRRAEKDTAELNMIVDLMRNDLGRVCEYNSVRVTQPRTIESHPTIHHGVATVEGTLHPSMDTVDLLRATLPGGSVTGAPKIRAMQIIDQLEPTPRGPYCGAIGTLSKNHTQLNIAIRTLLLTPDSQSNPNSYHATFSAGGGIVADSNPQAEYLETLDKAQAILQALNP